MAEPSVTVMETQLSCVACTGTFPQEQLAEVRCSDNYCKPCLEKIFETALKDETMFPPSCCGMAISLKLAQPHISKQTLRTYRTKSVELRVKNRTYCWKANCSAFIAPHSIHNGEAICQRCRARTCSRCKNRGHFGPCVEGEDAAFFKLVRARKLKKCPSCKRMVEKNGGCNHVVCRCGCEICYGCGNKFDQCECSGDEDDVSDDDVGCTLFD
jgi:hypothetical protein